MKKIGKSEALYRVMVHSPHTFALLKAKNRKKNMHFFDERCQALHNGKSVYTVYDGDIKRAFHFFDEDNIIKVFVKRDDGLEAELDYNRSEDAKEALYRGETITKEEYEAWGIKTSDSSYEQKEKGW